VTEVGHWLQELGLEKYAAVFAEHEITRESLADLTEADINRLGLPTGPRRRLIIALQALGAATRAQRPAQQADAVAGPGISYDAHRCQLTVMFCDLVGSAALAEQLDPEELRELMKAYRNACSVVVARYEGYVAQYRGDGLMVYFGWPSAHEDDAERGVRAAAEIVQAVKRVSAEPPLAIRIGMATGTVVVGGVSSADDAEGKRAVGETLNLAARLQELAAPDEIVIAPATRHLIGAAFELTDLGAHLLKGIAEPVRASRVDTLRMTEGRFESARGGVPLTPLVGREDEVRLLVRCWHQAAQGRGRVVLLRGEPGIGKSRIALELCRLLAQSPHHLVRYQCSPYHTNSAFFPVIAQLERAAGFNRSDAPLERLDKLDALLSGLGSAGSKLAPAYAALLSLPLDRYPSSGMSATKQKENIIGALVSGMIALSASKAALLIFEDAHWVDPTTLETLGALVDAIVEHPVLLVITHRLEFTPPWTARSHVSIVPLRRLSPDQSARMVAAVAGGEALTNDILNQIVAKTDGIPLFVEEVTKSVLTQIQECPHGRLTPARVLNVPEIPVTLKDLLMARLDRLGEAKKIAQIGAVMGRRFSYAATVALSGSGGRSVARGLQKLVRHGLVFRRRTPSDTTFTFRHALIHDAAYESLLKSERQILHRRAGDLLSEHFPETAESEPELLARHYTIANVSDRAVQYWLRAGQKAWQRSAAKEAIAHLSCGLELIDKVADAATRDALELGLQAALGVVYFATVSYVAPQAQAAFLRAYELCERVKQAELLAPVLYGIGAFQTMKGNVHAGHAAFEKLMIVANTANRPSLLLYTHAVLTWSNYNQADYRTAIWHADQVQALSAAKPSQGPRLSAADPMIISETFRALALWSLGFPDQAEKVSNALLARARVLHDPYSLAYALNFGSALIPALCGEHQRAVERADEGIVLAHELGYPFMEMSGTLWRAWPASHISDPARVLSAEKAALEKCRALGFMYQYPQLLARRTRLLIRLGHVDEAQVCAAEGLALVEESGEHSIEPDVYQAMGDSLQAADASRWCEAEACYVKALELARKQLAKGWELRAATALALLWHTQGKRKEAYDLLAPICNWFTEGFDTHDLKAARQLLGSLR